MKRLLFVNNTLGRAGAEMALMELLRCLDPKEYEVDLYVVLGQGEMVNALPENVRLINSRYDEAPVLGKAGKRRLRKTLLASLFKRGNIIRLFPYMLKNFILMLRKRRLLTEKLLWRVAACGAERFDTYYDMAAAFLEGGSTYYVADYVNAGKYVAFVHVDYEKAGYSRALDKDCYLKYDKVFTVSNEVREAFISVYPELNDKTEIFNNIINRKEIIRKAAEGEGFRDDFDGIRILSVGRLTAQKAFEVSINAMKLLKDSGKRVRWYVLGEGNQRKKLEELVEGLGLTEDFIMPGAVDNPYPYMKQADIYVHASKFEGKSIAIQEAQVLGKPMVVSDCSGNREQVIQNVDGILCDFTADAIYEAVSELIDNKEKRTDLGRAAAKKSTGSEREKDKLLSILEG